MRKLTINAFNYEEAKNKAAEMGINVVRNVTPSYKKFDGSFDAFMDAQTSKSKLDEGDGLCVVLETGTPDTRNRPYKFVNCITEGKMRKRRVFEVRTTDDDYIGETESKAAAVRMAKAAMKDTKKDIVCKQMYRVDDDHTLAFTLKYVPSANTKLGEYVVFGRF